MTTAAIIGQFARDGERLAGADTLAGVRNAALARFGEIGLPGRSVETWHYTAFDRLAPKDLAHIAAPPPATAIAAARDAVAQLGLDAAAPRCVFVDGYLIDSLSTTAARRSLSIEPLADDPSHLLGGAVELDSPLVALNTAFASAGAHIRVTGVVDTPIQCIFVGATPGLATHLRLGIALEPDAAATMTQHFLDLDGVGNSWLNLVVDIEQQTGSHIAVYRSQRHGPERVHTALTRATLAERTRCDFSAVELGGHVVRNEIQIALDGEGARAEFRGLALARDTQHCDTRVALDHRAANSVSRQTYRAIAAGRSRSVFNGKVTVAEDAQHIDARQRNDNLLLSPTAEIDTKPELEIYADQVICSHGATIGELSDEHLFYLRARGIDIESARDILTSAFAEVILAAFELAEFRQHARDAVAAAMPRHAEHARAVE
jgi:Fe-S cluster assembly protein SufD